METNYMRRILPTALMVAQGMIGPFAATAQAQELENGKLETSGARRDKEESKAETQSRGSRRDVLKPKDEATRLEEIVVAATRTEKDPFEAPYTVDAIGFQDIQHRRLSRTVPEALKETAGVMVQKTSYGQASPFLWVFTGLRTLFPIDGIRLDNSVFREGPNQYWNTVDPFTINRLETIKGPIG